MHFEFPAYKAADFFEVCRHHDYSDFKAIVKEILEVEAPLSEDLFLKRIVWYFEHEKVTNVVQRSYEPPTSLMRTVSSPSSTTVPA